MTMSLTLAARGQFSPGIKEVRNLGHRSFAAAWQITRVDNLGSWVQQVASAIPPACLCFVSPPEIIESEEICQQLRLDLALSFIQESGISALGSSNVSEDPKTLVGTVRTFYARFYHAQQT